VCWLSGRKITPADKWDLDHKIALCNGGKNCESNLAPALRDKHREKTKADVAERTETDGMSKRHFGIKPKHRAFRKPVGYTYSWSRSKE
jgi:5-methylcytosine-specific restriction endonuclease McrA